MCFSTGDGVEEGSVGDGMKVLPYRLILRPLSSIMEANFYFFVARKKEAPFVAKNYSSKRFRVGDIKKVNNKKVKFMDFWVIFV